MTDKQSLLLGELIEKLKVVPDFGERVFEDSVLRVIDDADEELPESFIVIQPGATQEQAASAGRESITESVVFNITLITKRYAFAPHLRAGRLAVKQALKGRKCSLAHAHAAEFAEETPMPPQPGRTWAAHVMPLQITYVQNL